MRHLIAVCCFALLLSPLGCGDDHGHSVPHECEEIGAACHTSTTPLGMECHDNAEGVWTVAECAAERAACLAECSATADAGPADAAAGDAGSDAY